MMLLRTENIFFRLFHWLRHQFHESIACTGPDLLMAKFCCICIVRIFFNNFGGGDYCGVRTDFVTEAMGRGVSP